MKAIDLMEAIGAIDDKYLAEAEELPFSTNMNDNRAVAITEIEKKKESKSIHRQTQRTIATAACMLLAVGVIAFGTNEFRMNSVAKGVAPASQIAFSEAAEDVAEDNGNQENVAQVKNFATGKMTANKDETVYVAEDTKNPDTDQNNEVSETAEKPMVIHLPVNDMRRMIQIQGTVYVDTEKYDETESRCGNMDGEITSTTETMDAIPQEDNQANFGTGFRWQWGRQENEVEVLIDDKWHIFKALETGATEGEQE